MLTVTASTKGSVALRCRERECRRARNHLIGTEPNMCNEYSEKERELFAHFGFEGDVGQLQRSAGVVPNTR